MLTERRVSRLSLNGRQGLAANERQENFSIYIFIFKKNRFTARLSGDKVIPMLIIVSNSLKPPCFLFFFKKNQNLHFKGFKIHVDFLV
jgi:hypothetical protein